VISCSWVCSAAADEIAGAEDGLALADDLVPLAAGEGMQVSGQQHRRVG
jgi:hypothetical protein